MKELVKQLQQQFDIMCDTGMLFRSQASTHYIWALYLSSFGEDQDPVFRDPASTIHNCNNCHNFVRRYGNIVAIIDGELTTMFSDIEIDEEYKSVVDAMDVYIKRYPIVNVFFETFDELNSLPYESCNKSQQSFLLGLTKNVKRYTREEAELYGVVKPNEIKTFNHMYVSLPKKFVDQSGNSVEAIMGHYRDKYSVFKRAMEEISIDTFELVKDLINQGSLLDGTAHLHAVKAMIPLKEQYLERNTATIENWYWQTIYDLPEVTAKFRNTLIGVLCTELTEGMELNKACENWNKRVDPVNYHRATAPITKKQIDEAKAFVTENGYLESFDRRVATIDDINVSEIKHISTEQEIKSVTIFDNVKSTSSQHKRSTFDNIEEISVDTFMKNVLPNAKSISVLLENRLENNLVTLTTAKKKRSKLIFKWDNNYSWNFNGNFSGKSQIKKSVKAQGGKIDAVLRFSIGWAEGDPSDNSDLDAHAQEPQGGEHIYYSSYRGVNNLTQMSGNLDVDITHPNDHGNKDIVENITWRNLNQMKDGTYKLWINQYANRGSKSATAEIEFDDTIYTYSYNKPVHGNVQVAEVTLKNGQFSIKHILPLNDSITKDLWGLETNDFHKVNLVCLSPNHWGDNNVGNLHYMFMLDGCKTPNAVRGFHNEHLLPDLLKHRKVMEVLGATNMIESNGKQLSGLGFNSTVRDEVIVKVSGSHKRMLKVKF